MKHWRVERREMIRRMVNAIIADDIEAAVLRWQECLVFSCEFEPFSCESERQKKDAWITAIFWNAVNQKRREGKVVQIDADMIAKAEMLAALMKVDTTKYTR